MTCLAPRKDCTEAVDPTDATPHVKKPVTLPVCMSEMDLGYNSPARLDPTLLSEREAAVIKQRSYLTVSTRLEQAESTDRQIPPSFTHANSRFKPHHALILTPATPLELCIPHIALSTLSPRSRIALTLHSRKQKQSRTTSHCSPMSKVSCSRAGTCEKIVRGLRDKSGEKGSWRSRGDGERNGSDNVAWMESETVGCVRAWEGMRKWEENGKGGESKRRAKYVECRETGLEGLKRGKGRR